MNKGDRKLKAFYVTIACVMIVFMTAILKGVPLTGDNVIAIGFVLAGVGTAFSGANAVEHYSKAKTPPPAAPVP
jgi:predicted membrane channel-forming protein YqfA (hemolysin III family)